MLTYGQVAFFRHCGYFALEQVIPEALVDAVHATTLEHVRSQIRPFRRHDGRIVRLDQLWDRAQVFREVIEHPVIMKPLVSLLGPNIEFMRLRHNHATLNGRDDNTEGRGGMGYHRDSLQWSRPIITVIVYCDAATYDNGATLVIPGSHFLPYVGMPLDGRGGNWLKDHPEYREHERQGVPVAMPRGGVLLFDSLLFHSSGRNRTDDTRMSLTLGYRSVDELCRDGREECELVRGERIYRGNDEDVKTGNWFGDVVV